MTENKEQTDIQVKHFRQILLWPLQLMPVHEDEQIQNHWELLETPGSPWAPVTDEFTDDPADFQDRHYGEFVTFLPNIQRMLYGESLQGSLPVPPALRVYRRDDIAQVRLVFPDQDRAAMVLDVAHVDLYFFYDLDVVILALEVFTENTTLALAQECLYRLGRSYPTYWDTDGHGGHCLQRAEWLDRAGTVLAVSDYEYKEKYLTSVCRNRAAGISAHWEYLLQPMVLDHTQATGPIRYRLLEYHRMPVLGYLAVDDARRLSRADFIRLAFVTLPDARGALPFSENYLQDFERRYCCDRYWNIHPDLPSGNRVLCSGESMMMVGNADDDFYVDRHHGLLEQFRHQYFLVMLLPHLHKAALLMMSDRLIETMVHLDIRDTESVKRFKRRIRQLKEILLRFTHRYWFYNISDQPLPKEVYRLCQGHLDTERLYEQVKDDIESMIDYLDSDALRRQANTVVRLTVVTIFGLIGTVTVGWFGMNLLDETASSPWRRLSLFLAVFIPIVLLTFYTMVKSKRLSDFLEALSNERLGAREKFGAFLNVWRKSPRH